MEFRIYRKGTIKNVGCSSAAFSQADIPGISMTVKLQLSTDEQY
ncbi:hypothetical protein [Siminovitchia fordii]|nr:hypothetical protein [Siminovitchia fordii]